MTYLHLFLEGRGALGNLAEWRKLALAADTLAGFCPPDPIVAQYAMHIAYLMREDFIN
jgi:hypothetical protein